MTSMITRRNALQLAAGAATLAAVPRTVAAAAILGDGPVAQLNRRYFSIHCAYEEMPDGLPHSEVLAREEALAIETRAVDLGLAAARPTTVPEAIALLEVARSDFEQFHRGDDGSFGDVGEDIVFNALDSALRVLRSIT
jgi:hypothetical protein